MGLSGSLCRSPRLMVINLVGDVGARIDRGESRDKLLRFAVVVVVGIDVRAAGWDRGTQNCRAEVRGGGGRGVRSSATLARRRNTARATYARKFIYCPEAARALTRSDRNLRTFRTHLGRQSDLFDFRPSPFPLPYCEQYVSA